jgi:hypothetical protein
VALIERAMNRADVRRGRREGGVTMFQNDPNLYGLTYRDYPVRPPFFGMQMIPFEKPVFGFTPWETVPRYVPPFYGFNPWETIPRFVPPQFGLGQQPMFHTPQQLPFPQMQYPQLPFAPYPPQMGFNPFLGFNRPFGV